ncbi:hypothetical protein TNCV_1539441 [Trichonephila clavipes]|nr:hypothetical protein TNCV_1539441 [Trichonephila clavipes]
MPVKHNVFLWNLPDVEEVPSHDGETVPVRKIICLISIYLSYSPCLFRFFVCFKILPLVSMGNVCCGQRGTGSGWPLWHAAKTKQSSRAGASKVKAELKLELVKVKQNFRETLREKGRTREVREQALPLNMIVKLTSCQYLPF